jgi:glycosyltransferase involved in cell wall biosynthesis
MNKGVVMLVNEFPPLKVGGAERQAQRLSEYLSRHGWFTWVITRHQKLLAHDEIQDGLHLIRPVTMGPGKLKTITFVLGTLWWLWRLKDDYEILHAHLAFGPAFAGVVASRILGKCSIVKFGNSGEFGDVFTSQKTLRGRFRLFVMRQWADVVIVLDEIMRREVIAAGFDSKRVRLMSNGIDVSHFNLPKSESAPQAFPNPKNKIFAIYVGRLTKQKSLSALLQAVAIAIQTCPTLHLILLGEGPERINLEHQADALGITTHITFAGYCENVGSYLQSAHIFVLPSVSEGISNALLEAMAFGLPCLASSIGGNVEVLDHGKYGVLLPPGDVKAWAQALEDMVAIEPLRLEMGELAHRRIVESYDFSVIGMRYEELYKELLTESRKN